jgi:hypothetical protein
MNQSIYTTFAEITATISRWIKSDEKPSPHEFEELRRKVTFLEYLYGGDIGWEERKPAMIVATTCAEPGCNAIWKSTLKNHAPQGGVPIWFCPLHEKTTTKVDDEGRQQSVHIPGSPEFTPATREQKATDMAKRWDKYLADLQGEKL